MTSLAWTPPRVRDGWRVPLAAVFSLQLLILLAFRETGMAMVEIWLRSETFTHAFVVPPIVAWLIWRKRAELAPLQPQPQAWMLLPMAVLALMWWLGALVNVAAAMQLALVAMLVACVPLLLGGAVTRALAFPLAFLFFAVPIGEFLTPVLMHWTAEMLVAGLRATGIPVYQEGQQLVIPSGRWAVVAACSGIRYLMATFMVGSLFAYLNYSSARKRLIFIAISLVVPVIANWVRAYIIVMLGHLSNNEIATGVDHLIYGWIFFGVIILALFFVGARWADPDDSAEAAELARRQAADQAGPQAAGWRLPVLAGVALLALLWPFALQREAAVIAGPVELRLPERLGDWQASPLPERAWRPFFSTATVQREALYGGPQGQVAVHVAYYRGQQGDVKLVSSINRFVESGNWRWHVLSEGRATVPLDDRTLVWRRATLLSQEGASMTDGSRARLTVWRLYWMHGATAHDDVRGKLLQAWQAVRGLSDDGAAVHLVSSLADDAAAEQQLARFVADNYAMLARALAQAGAAR